MDSSKDTETEKLSLDPDNMTNEELLQISLTVLTKNVAPSLPDYSVVLLYAQWLNVHCQNPTSLTQYWTTTTMHWVHALRSRGCSPSDIIHGLDVWKHLMAEIGSAYSTSRSLPTDKEVTMLYDIQSVESLQSTGQAEYYGQRNGVTDYMAPPPGSYICNRCGIPGHHLQVCPTNLDPAYDKAPGDTYTCAVCHLNGAHYRSLCPHNGDPFSLTQQRRTALAAANYINLVSNPKATNGGHDPCGEYGQDANSSGVSPKSNYDSDSSKENEPKNMLLGQGLVVSADSIKKAQNVDDRNLQNGKRGRPLSSSTPSRSSNEGSPTPDKRQSLRKRMKRIEVYEDKLAKGKTLETTQIEMVRKKAVTQKELSSLDENVSGEMDKVIEGESQANDHFHHPSFSSGSSGLASLESLSINLPNTPSSAMRVATYNEFTQKLVDCHRDEMTAIVNVMKPRPTALDKWERLQVNNRTLAVRGVDVSSDPFLDEETVTNTEMAAAQYNNPLKYSTHAYYGAGYSLPGMYESFPKHRAGQVTTKTSQSSLLDDDPEFLPSCGPSLSRVGYSGDGYSKPFDKVIAPPSKPFDKVIAPPARFKALDKVIAPPKRVPKDITNLPKKEDPKEPESPFTKACRMAVAAAYSTDAKFVAGSFI